MEKGKKPIQEEEDLLSHLRNYSLNNGSSTLSPILFSGPTSQEATNPSQSRLIGPQNMVPNATANLPTLLQGSGSGWGPNTMKEDSVLDEMDDADEDFFFKFWTMNGTGSPNTKQSCEVPTSNLAQIAEASAEVPVETIVPASVSKPDPLVQPKAHSRKPMPADVLARLAIHDPKRAKRILTNRMSAVRAKERKKLYTYMLEHQLQSLLTESTTLSTRLSLMQRESKGLSAENAKLKQQTDIIVQRIRLQDSLNDEIRNEIQHLKMVAQIAPNQGNKLNSISGYSGSGYNNQARDAPFRTEQFPPGMQQLQNLYLEQQLQHGMRQLTLGQQPFQVQYEPGQPSQFQPMQQDLRQHHHQRQDSQQNHQLQDWTVQPQLLQRQQEQPLCMDGLNTENPSTGAHINTYFLP